MSMRFSCWNCHNQTNKTIHHHHRSPDAPWVARERRSTHQRRKPGEQVAFRQKRELHHIARDNSEREQGDWRRERTMVYSRLCQCRSFLFFMGRLFLLGPGSSGRPSVVSCLLGTWLVVSASELQVAPPSHPPHLVWPWPADPPTSTLGARYDTGESGVEERRV
jgi:hypothetical protein